jgi:hypothetical protein
MHGGPVLDSMRDKTRGHARHEVVELGVAPLANVA